MKKIVIISFFSILLTACNSSPIVSSPDGSLSVLFEQFEDGGIGYSVARDGLTIICSSPLGFLTAEQSLQDGFKIKGTKKETYSSVWETVWGEERLIEDHHNTLRVSLEHKSGLLLDIEFRVFNDGFAFRYIFPVQEKQELTITDELTAYHFTQDAGAWSIPWRTEYYEGLWSKRGITPTLSQREGEATKDTLCSPITIEFADGSYGFVHEAALTDYPAQNLYVRDGVLRTYLKQLCEGLYRYAV